jgi:hypothetical protein
VCCLCACVGVYVVCACGVFCFVVRVRAVCVRAGGARASVWCVSACVCVRVMFGVCAWCVRACGVCVCGVVCLFEDEGAPCR